MAAPSIPDGLDELRKLLVDPERKAIADLRFSGVAISQMACRRPWRTAATTAG